MARLRDGFGGCQIQGGSRRGRVKREYPGSRNTGRREGTRRGVCG